mmetsp:Transcript_16615/g.40909  ORF Transcript_16615/g.40909 Transcript_16615/m.40909 type:complete len:123 (+) Transcript_16615:37-405(+)
MASLSTVWCPRRPRSASAAELCDDGLGLCDDDSYELYPPAGAVRVRGVAGRRVFVRDDGDARSHSPQWSHGRIHAAHCGAQRAQPVRVHARLGKWALASIALTAARPHHRPPRRASRAAVLA